MRDLAAAIVTHAFWREVAGPELPDARSKLKHSVKKRGSGVAGGTAGC
ncbi:hypothetical protein AB0C70_42280 [Streptomyces sp. NPDC048564]